MSAETQGTPTTGSAVTVPVAAGTNLRRGVSVQGPDNVIGVVPAGSYTALGQCAGGAVQEGSAVNFWWVKISAGGLGDGWISAVRVLEGGNNEPIAGVAQLPTVQGN